MIEQNGVLLKRDSNSITISEFYENQVLHKYDYNPDYQRKGDVWSIEKQSFLIDSIFKNYPIPPIFLHSETDLDTGKTVYHVIDGKQRLGSIVKFINDELYLPENFGDDRYGDESLNGLKFSEIPSSSPFKKNFWKYRIPIEYVDTDDKDVVNRIFDRLNRNGQPLNAQELRNAKYNQSKLMILIRELTELKFWKERLEKVVEETRMEDQEFISELLFTMLIGTIDAKPETLDSFYNEWVDKLEGDPNEISSIKERFETITNYMDRLGIDYETFKIDGVSHLYGLWGFSIECIQNNANVDEVKGRLNDFFNILRDKHSPEAKNENISKYKNSMSYNTKSKGQRTKRIVALSNYCDIQ